MAQTQGARPTTLKPTAHAADSTVAGKLKTDSLATDSLAKDSTDSLHSALVFIPADTYHESEPRHSNGLQTSSWLLMALLVLLVAIGLKFRRSTGYIVMLARDVTNTRRRNNMFDDTVRESSFLLLLNIVTLLSGGMLLYLVLSAGTTAVLSDAGQCMGVALAYGLFMYGAYYLWGSIFTDHTALEVWVCGHTAAQGLLGFILLPLSLAAIADPIIAPELAYTGLGFFAVSKLVFIFKGARIFLNGPASVVVFFYYLCNLEMVPLILAYAAAVSLCQSAA